MPEINPVRSARARIAYYSRSDRGDAAKVDAARRELTAAHLERAITKALDAEPALTDEARAEMAQMLVGGDDR